MSAGERYLAAVGGILEDIAADEWPSIRAAAETVADTIAGDGLVHVFGTGHSHMLAEEMFYRAGGLAAVNPILIQGLMLHAGAENSTRLERQHGLAGRIFGDVPLKPGDTFIVASNSGGNAVCEELARLAGEAGASVVAIVSSRHAEHSATERGGSRLADLADVVIDNHGDIGDAVVDVDGLDRKVGPTSTVAGAAIVNAVVAEAVEILIARGMEADVFTSSNLPEGDAANSELVARYRDRVRAL
ncbi:MAG TPA: SIS domain-containing protein [Acidimicrobiia bacterium]|nr:SIS domain-containing protein [Acidimicrobiia bacterium]